MSSTSKLDRNCRTHFGNMNFNPNKITITAKTRSMKFEVLTSKQASFIKPIHPSLCSLIKNHANENGFPESTQYLRKQGFHESSDGFWLTTPENYKDASKLIGVEKKIYEFLMKFKKKKRLIQPLITPNENNSLENLFWISQY